MSARSLRDALSPEHYEVIEVGITKEGAWFSGTAVIESLSAGQTAGLTPVVMLPDPTRPGLFALDPDGKLRLFAKLDVILPALHGTFGEDGTLQGLLELAGIAYVGSGVLGSAVGMDKGLFKHVMQAHQIPVLESIVVLRSEVEQNPEDVLRRAEQVSNYPLFVKPANLGSSVGVSKCRNRSDLMEGLLEAAMYDRRILVERGIEAREIELSVLGNDQPKASIAGEILPSREFYTYEAKYLDNSSDLLIPAPLTAEQLEEAQQIALRAYQAADCAGLARVDFLMDKLTGSLYLSELNTFPGFTQISMYPKLWEASGISYPDLVDRLIQLALERHQDRKHTKFHYDR
jgi:D-alanine-D-alanine ligase